MHLLPFFNMSSKTLGPTILFLLLIHYYCTHMTNFSMNAFTLVFVSIIFYILQAHIKNCRWSNHLSIFGRLVIKVLMSMGHFIKKIHHACNLFKRRKIELLFWFHWQAMDSCLIQVLQGTVEHVPTIMIIIIYILYVYILYCMSLNLD